MEPTTPRYAIYSPSESEYNEEPMYWSNTLGWTTPDQADTFSQDETKRLRLPIPDGMWIMVKGIYDDDE